MGGSRSLCKLDEHGPPALRPFPDADASVSCSGCVVREITGAIQAKIVDWVFLYDPRYGALTELYAGFSDDIGLDNNGVYVIPWGVIGTTRADISAGLC